jgi:DNA repair ATPase RecN
MKKQLLTLTATLLFAFPLYGFAEELPSTALGVASTTKNEEASSTDATPVKTFTTCSQEAIEARDTKIATSRIAYNTAMSNALTERKNREKAAVAIADEDDKKDAIKASVDTYKHQAKAAQATLTQARKLAWQTFDNDIKACRDLEQITEDTTATLKSDNEQAPTARTMMMKKGAETEITETKPVESKSFKDTIKDKFESIKSLFN